jgi:3-hydroxyisobutyrate dehydrogenase-like beta-hydroxyacid dehydrogenase
LILQEQDNPNGFATKLASKDLRLIQETASIANVSLPIADLIQLHFREIISLGGGQKDLSLLVSHLRNTLTVLK